METCLTVVLILGACLALSLNRPLLFLISLGLAPTARPEALLLLPLVPFGLATCLHPRPPLLHIGLASLISAIPMGLWSCFCLSVTLYRSFSERRSRLSSDCRAISIVNVMMGKWLASNTPPDAVVGVCDAGAVRYFGNRQTIDFGGLNHAEIAFKRITLKDAVAKTDFLAVFPRLFDRRLADDFSPCMTITIPQNEYTISPTPNQTLHVAFRRNRPGTADRNRPLSSIPLQK